METRRSSGPLPFALPMALCALRCAKWQRNGLLGAASTSCVFGGLTHLYYALREHDLQLLAVACTILKHPSNIFNPSNQHVEALSLLQMSRVAPCRTVSHRLGVGSLVLVLVGCPSPQTAWGSRLPSLLGDWDFQLSNPGGSSTTRAKRHERRGFAILCGRAEAGRRT